MSTSQKSHKPKIYQNDEKDLLDPFFMVAGSKSGQKLSLGKLEKPEIRIPESLLEMEKCPLKKACPDLTKAQNELRNVENLFLLFGN